MKSKRWAAVIAVALALSGCGVQAAAQGFAVNHLACPAINYYAPVWSADGARIFYAEGSQAGTFVRSMTAAGGDNHPIAGGGIAMTPSPDGRWLLYLRSDSNTSWMYDLLELATGQIRPLGDLGYAPAWSPDSRSIAYAVTPGGPLMSVDPATGQKSAIGGEAVRHMQASDPQWSPDGQSIAFQALQDGADALYLLSVGDGSLTRLTPDQACADGGKESESLQGWRPDGGALAAIGSCSGKRTPYLVTPGGRDLSFPAALYPDPSRLSWSPDGGHLLMQEGGGTIILRVAGADGSGPRRIATGTSLAQWSPDGRIVFVTKDTSGLDEVFIIDQDGAHLTQLTSNPGGGLLCLH